jgi:hypothetical protein
LYYLADEEVRSVKRDLGLRRAAGQRGATAIAPIVERDVASAVRHLNRVARDTTNPVLKSVAKSFKAYLQ